MQNLSKCVMMTKTEILEGCIVAKRRNRFRQFESLMTKVLLADALVFILFLIFSGFDVVSMKVITAIISILGSGLALGYLYLNGEFKKRRSLWMVLGFASILVCLLFSLFLGYPGPM